MGIFSSFITSGVTLVASIAGLLLLNSCSKRTSPTYTMYARQLEGYQCRADVAHHGQTIDFVVLSKWSHNQEQKSARIVTVSRDGALKVSVATLEIPDGQMKLVGSGKVFELVDNALVGQASINLNFDQVRSYLESTPSFWSIIELQKKYQE